MKDALPNDVYADENGKLWRVVGIFTEPSVIVEAIEDKSDTPERKHVGASAYAVSGFKRILRHCDHKWQHEAKDPRGGLSAVCAKCGEIRHVL